MATGAMEGGSGLKLPPMTSQSGLTLSNLRTEAEVRARQSRGFDSAAMYSEPAQRFFAGVEADEWVPKIDPPSKWRRRVSLAVFASVIAGVSLVLALVVTGQW